MLLSPDSHNRKKPCSSEATIAKYRNGKVFLIWPIVRDHSIFQSFITDMAKVLADRVLGLHEASVPQRLLYSLPVYVSLEQQIADGGKWRLLNTRMRTAFEAARVCAIEQISAQLTDSDAATKKETSSIGATAASSQRHRQHASLWTQLQVLATTSTWFVDLFQASKPGPMPKMCRHCWAAKARLGLHCTR